MTPLVRRLALVALSLVAFAGLPASAAADCNGPACEPMPVVEGSAIAVTVLIVLMFVTMLVAAEARRR